MKKILLLLLFTGIFVQAEAGKYIVTFEKDPVCKVITDRTKVRKSSYRSELLNEQKKFSRIIESEYNGKVTGGVTTVLNAVFVEMTADQADKLKKHKGILRVSEDRLRFPVLDTARNVHKLDEALAKISINPETAGRGIKIAILDTGFDINNVMFDDTGYTYPEGFDPGNGNFEEFTNNKVIVAKVFSTASSPHDETRGHGTAVASCAAGSRVTLNYLGMTFDLQGSAPGAYLGNYRVFPDGDGGARESSIINAVNEAVEDGMDILNLSLGGPVSETYESDNEVQAIENAVDAGAVVCISAGNDGYDNYREDGSTPTGETQHVSVGSPGNAPSCITVGATSNARYLSVSKSGSVTTEGISVPESLNSFTYGTDSQNASLLETSFGPYEIVDISNYGVDELGCTPYNGVNISGKVALIKRGECNFSDKMRNAQNAGAVGAVIYDHTPDQALITMNIDDNADITIPGFFIRNNEGVDLKDFLAQSAEPVDISFNITGSKEALRHGFKSTFSSYGTTNIDYLLKPDVCAVGDNLITAAPGEYGFWIPTQGTSFSSPLVAGHMAVLKNRYPELTPAELKGIISCSTEFATNYYMKEAWSFVTGKGISSPYFTGGGKVDMMKALNAKVTVVPNNLGFGKIWVYDGNSGTKTKTATIKNISDQTIYLQPSLLKIVDNEKANAELLINDTFSLLPGESYDIDLTINYASRLKSELQGFIILKDNFGMTYHIPYHATLVTPNFTIAGTSDSDVDSLTKNQENLILSDMFISDTDGDGFDDGEEVNTYATDPGNATDTPEIASFDNKVYIPFASTEFSDDFYTATDVYIVNPNNDSATFVIKFYSADGDLIHTARPQNLNANGWQNVRLSGNIAPSDVGWIQIDSTLSIKAMADFLKIDSEGNTVSSYAIPGTDRLMKNVVVSHVAEQTYQWETQLFAAIPGVDSAEVSFTPAGGSSVVIGSLGDPLSFSRNEIVSEFYGGEYPFTTSDGSRFGSHWWGTLDANTSGEGIVAGEMFSQNDGIIDQSAGLLLTDEASTEILIPHVATDWVWWTGVALNNVNDSQATLTLIPYDDSGNELSRVTLTIPAYEKYVGLVQSFWSDNSVEYPSETAWFKILSNLPITGYELFGIQPSSGSEDRKDVLAGIEAITESKTSHIIPYAFFTDSKMWTGVAVLNSGDSNALVTLTAYNALGMVVGQASQNVAAGQKILGNIDNTSNSLIPNVQSDVRWIKVESDNPVACIELFGGFDFYSLSGIPAL